MTIYWERCDFCGRYEPVKQCTLYPDLMVCIHCCLSCPKRKICPKPVWFIEFKIKTISKPGKIAKEADKTKVFQELLSKLGS
ncbi:hypothetical protein D1872_282670 [compost metagenome]